MGKIERGALRGTGVGKWIQRRQTEFCDEVEPVEILDTSSGENVAWVHRRGISDKGFFDMFHIACDHLGPVQRGESEIQALLGCKAVQKVLAEKAISTSRDDNFQIDKILPFFTYREGGELMLDQEGETIAGKFVYEALFKTIAEPDRCHGNIRSGVHVKPMIQVMLGGVAEGQIDIVLEDMRYQGVIEREDPLIYLAA
jgi:hypothetical protein